MKRKAPLPEKITSGVAAAGIILLALGVFKENQVTAIAGLALMAVGFFAKIVVSALRNIKSTYPARDDPFQKKMRVLCHIEFSAGCTAFLSVGLLLYALYSAKRWNRLLSLALSIMAVGIVVNIAVAVIIQVMSKIYDSRAKLDPLPPAAAVPVPHSDDPVVSEILANPYILLDERIRQIHEVQNLLQYHEIQQVFFEPVKLYELFTNDKIAELLNVVRDWIVQNDPEKIFAAAEQKHPAQPTVLVNNTKPKKNKQSNTVFWAVFVMIWIVVITAIVIVLTTNSID